jgi:DNA modification methylase
MTLTGTCGTIKVQMLKTGDIIPFARNSRTHSEAQVGQIAASVKEFGWTNPILIDGENGIIAGHGRLLAAQALGMAEVPCIMLDHLTDAQKRALVIADNKLAMNAGWDDLLLSSEIEGLNEDGFDLSLLGFNEDELAALLVTEVEGLTDEDAVPEAPEIPVTVEGDVWLLGRHRLMCGDSTSIDAVDKLMDGQKADMVFTDPPYALFGNSTGVAGITDDNMVRSFFRDIMVNLKCTAKPYAHIYMCCDWHSAFSIEAVSRSVELKAKNLCIWDKGDGGVGAMYQQCYEMVWFFDNSPTSKTTMGKVKSGVRTVNGRPNIWRVKRHMKDRVHNAQKPVDLVRIPIEASTDSGDTIVDLFGGSGTTLIAAECESRASRLMELDPKYCDVIITRWQEFTGQIATHAESGKSFNELADKDIKKPLCPEVEAA